MLPGMCLDGAHGLERLLDVPVAHALARIGLEPDKQSIEGFQRPRRMPIGKRKAPADRLMPVRVSHGSAGSSRRRRA